MQKAHRADPIECGTFGLNRKAPDPAVSSHEIYRQYRALNRHSFCTCEQRTQQPTTVETQFGVEPIGDGCAVQALSIRGVLLKLHSAPRRANRPA